MDLHLDEIPHEAREGLTSSVLTSYMQGQLVPFTLSALVVCILKTLSKLFYLLVFAKIVNIFPDSLSNSCNLSVPSILY